MRDLLLTTLVSKPGSFRNLEQLTTSGPESGVRGHGWRRHRRHGRRCTGRHVDHRDRDRDGHGDGRRDSGELLRQQLSEHRHEAHGLLPGSSVQSTRPCAPSAERCAIPTCPAVYRNTGRRVIRDAAHTIFAMPQRRLARPPPTARTLPDSRCASKFARTRSKKKRRH